MVIPAGYVQCDRCKDYFSKRTLKRHQRTCDGVTGNIYLRENPSKVSLQDAEKLDDGTYKCPHCGKIYNSKGICYHIWKAHGEGKDFDPNRGYAQGTRTVWNKGLTKETDDRVAKLGRKISKVVRDKSIKWDWQRDLDDDGKLHQRYINKRFDAVNSNIPFELSYEEYCQLLREAGLVSSQLGFSGPNHQNYVLGRYGDIGGYSYGNCRFITQKENIDEMVSHTTYQKVFCIEDNQEFPSISSAERHYKIYSGCIIDSFFYRNGYVPAIGKHFRRIN